MRKIFERFEKLGFYEEPCDKGCLKNIDWAEKCHFCRKGYFIRFQGKSTSFRTYIAGMNIDSCYFFKEEMPFVIRNIDKFERIDNELWGQGGLYRIKASDLLEILELEAEKK